jgi:hypothetical protein
LQKSDYKKRYTLFIAELKQFSKIVDSMISDEKLKQKSIFNEKNISLSKKDMLAIR